MKVRLSERTDKVDDVLQYLPKTILAAAVDDDDEAITNSALEQALTTKLNETEIALDKLGKELERTKRELENWKRRATKAEATVDWQNRVIAQKEQESNSWLSDTKVGIIAAVIVAVSIMIYNLVKG